MRVAPAEKEQEIAHTQRERTKRVREAYTQRERSTIHTKTKREYHVIHTEQQCYTYNDVNRYGVNIYQLDTGWGQIVNYLTIYVNERRSPNWALCTKPTFF